MKKAKSQGFTLIELIVVATILGVVMTVGIVSYGQANIKSRDTRRKGDLEQIRSALEMYRADYGYYPDSGSGSYVDVGGATSGFLYTALVTGGYMPAIPDDPKPSSYSYYYLRLDGAGTPTRYYGYCLSSYLEGGAGPQPCTVRSGDNYTTKNP